MKYKLANQGVYRTIQGEGVLLGVPMIFIRLAGCSIGCPGCDTDYDTFEEIETGEIIQRVENLSTGNRDWIWLTGGEPTDQNLEELVMYLKKFDHPVAIATAGTRLLPGSWYDWISVSPHTKNLVQQSGHELKFVPGLNGLYFKDIEGMDFGMFAYKYIQVQWPKQYHACVEFVMKNPGWRLGIQAHKYWRLP